MDALAGKRIAKNMVPENLNILQLVRIYAKLPGPSFSYYVLWQTRLILWPERSDNCLNCWSCASSMNPYNVLSRQ